MTHAEAEAGRPQTATGWTGDVAALAGSLVHEIKNPLSTLSINTQLLLEDAKDGDAPPRTVKRLEVMASEIDRLERIMRSFLRFTARHELNLQKTSLNSALEDLVEFIGRELQDRDIEPRLWLDPELEPFYFDPDLLRQVFLNLIRNAERAMEESGGELILRTQRLEEDDRVWAVCHVLDTGCGISPKNLERIFDLYFSTSSDGHGLGLATSKRITEEHGGLLKVQSELGKGSQFSVYLPLRLSEAEVAPETDSGHGPESGSEVSSEAVSEPDGRRRE